MDANNLYGHSTIQPLPYDEIELWHGNPDPYMNNLEENLITPDDSDFGYFVEVDLRYPYKIKEKQRNFHFFLKLKLFLKINKIILRRK